MSEADTAAAGPAADDVGAGGDTHGQPADRTRSWRYTALIAALAVVAGVGLAVAFTFGVSALSALPGRPAMRPAGIPSNVSTPLADLMQLSPVPGAAAPGFTLTDQAGKPVSLASFRGKAVVLTFMDSHCTDVCPIVSREYIDAHRYLGVSASQVVFVAVNVNPNHLRVADVAAFSSEQQLNTLGSSWYFLTGSLASLRAIWHAYGIEVIAPNPTADVIHTSIIYFIDRQGRERYVAAPMDDHTKKGVAYLPPAQLTSWARGIALVSGDIVR